MSFEVEIRDPRKHKWIVMDSFPPGSMIRIGKDLFSGPTPEDYVVACSEDNESTTVVEGTHNYFSGKKDGARVLKDGESTILRIVDEKLKKGRIRLTHRRAMQHSPEKKT